MAIESEIEVLKSVVNKLDSSLEKISEVSNNIGRLLAVHNERLDQLEKVSDQRNDDIKELHSRITTQTREILDKITALEKNMEDRMRDSAKAAKEQHEAIQKEIQADIVKLDDRVESVERWRWYITGAAALAGYIIGNFADIAKILK